MTSPPLIFVRHGETDWNLNGIIQGWTDTQLNDKGQAQARAVGAALARDKHVLGALALITSPMLRTRQTMAAITAALNRSDTDVTVEPRVKELGFGVWEGHFFWELKASPLFPADPVSRFSWRPEGGESYADGLTRLEPFVAALTGPTLIVAHGAIGRCLIGLLCGYDVRSIVTQKMAQGCFCRIEGGKAQWFDATAPSA